MTANDPKSVDHIRFLSTQAKTDPHYYIHDEIGYNYRMTNIEAAIGLGQLERVDEHIAARKQVAQWYAEDLADMAGCVEVQKVTPGAESVWWMFSILLTGKAKRNRDELAEILQEKGIETRPLFYPMHIMPVYEDRNANCPVCEGIAARGLNLPTHALLSREDVAYICGAIKEAVL